MRSPAIFDAIVASRARFSSSSGAGRAVDTLRSISWRAVASSRSGASSTRRASLISSVRTPMAFSLAFADFASFSSVMSVT
jgi:hypothetical protein